MGATTAQYANINRGIITQTILSLSEASSGAAISVPVKSKTFSIDVSASGGSVDLTVTIKASHDGVTYRSIFSKAYTAAANEGYENNSPWPYIQASISSHSAGAATVIMGV